ncbi:disulfide bond formation protein DsbA [Nocardioides sp. Root1257]|uniref:DsbA family oxidoreductase n=1 Tax=unclassified Nocardioides TaxID=2615069 RepID=UPI0006F8E756|nr:MULTISPECIES: DsbA family oxidoreductase [unclassified Nocardioides]KQW53660.1 disulfide bond formation protein DsbA [Nocardioides sp. Root1257]KRC56346.1 disulfide bond formation protein DsbA [Nocardioides sp. Root224]
MKIEIWSDVVCPWCFVGKRRLETALSTFEHADDVEVVYRSFELDPTAPHHGHELSTGVIARKYGRSEDEMRDMQQQLIELAAEEGLAFRLFETVHTNTIDAHRLLHLALETGGPALQRELKEALLSAYFEGAADVGDHDVLASTAQRVGLDSGRVREVLEGDEYADAVAADIAQARAYGATGVPFFVVDQKYGVSGAQPATVFSQLLDQAWSESHPVLQMTGGDAEACGPDGCPV